MFAGEQGPFAAVGDREGGVDGWIPYVQVEDVDREWVAVPEASPKRWASLLREGVALVG